MNCNLCKCLPGENYTISCIGSCCGNCGNILPNATLEMKYLGLTIEGKHEFEQDRICEFCNIVMKRSIFDCNTNCGILDMASVGLELKLYD